MSFSTLDLYLTSKEQKTLQWMDETQKSCIQNVLDRGLFEQVNKVRSILEIVPLAQKTLYFKTSNCFFTTLVKEIDSVREENLAKVLNIFEKGGCDPFFRCATTKKTDYYSISKLDQIITEFDKIFKPLKKGSKAPDVLMSCPCFDEGGENFLEKIQRTTQTDTPNDHLKNVIASRSTLEIFKLEAKMYLASLPENQRAPIELYDDFFRLLNSNPKKEAATLLLKSVISLTSHPTKPSYQKITLDHLKIFEAAVQSVQKNCGDFEFLSLCTGLACLDSPPTLDEATYVFGKLEELYRDPFLDVENIQNELKTFQEGKIEFAKLLPIIERKNLAGEDLPLEGDIESILERFKGDEKTVLYPLPKDKLTLIVKQYALVKTFCEEWKNASIDDLAKKAHDIEHSACPDSEENTLQLVAIGRLALRFHHHYPHVIQVLTVLAQISFEKGCFAQVKTGEGKTLTFALMCFVLAKRKKEIHLISSSQDLSIRDQKRFAPFFKEFNISTSHICYKNQKPEHFQAQILYGAPSDFMFAVMREMLYHKKLFSTDIQSDIQNRYALIDEVDNLILDVAQNEARLCSNFEFDANWVYVPILSFVKDQKKHSKSLVSDLREYLSSYQQEKFRENVKFLSDGQLKTWLASATYALAFLEEKQDYIILEKKDSNGKLAKRIEIIDKKNTGKILDGQRWDKGIHQFLQAKHGLETDDESLVPISMSVSVFYQHYKALFGLTGTMGNKVERDEIEKIYNINSFDVPTYQPSLRKDLPTIILPDKQSQILTIINKIQRNREQKRPTLVLCYTVEDTQYLDKVFSQAGIVSTLFNEVQEEKAEDILEKAGREGAVTIATNNAGRGIDILLKGASKKNGGLEVIFSFWPESLRVEDQGRGRAGRQGQDGSSQIIVSEDEVGCVADLEKERSRKIIYYSAKRKMLAEKNRFVFSFVQKFFKRLHDFHSEVINNPGLLRKIAAELGSHKISKNKPTDFSHLSMHDRAIANDALLLLTSVVNEETKWLALLKNIADRIEKKTVENWTTNFLQIVADPSKDTTEFSKFQIQCHELFRLQEIGWEKNINLDGRGLLNYLREIIGSTFESKNEDSIIASRQEFYRKVGGFQSQVVNSDRLLEKLAEQLGRKFIPGHRFMFGKVLFDQDTHALKEYKKSVSHLPSQDQVFGERAFKLLNGYKNQEEEWLSLLKEIVEYLKKKAVDDRAMNLSHEWDKYIHSEGSGVLTYLREITGAGLKKIVISKKDLFDAEFYEKIGGFQFEVVNNSQLLQKFADELGPLKILKQNKTDFSDLLPPDQVLAKDAIKLLTSDQNEKEKWPALLKAIAERLQSKAIKARQKNGFQWDAYLDFEGNGLITYLRQITGATLRMK